MKRAVLLPICGLLLSACASTPPAAEGGVDTLALYRQMTQAKSQLQVRVGEPTQLSGSEKLCITARCSEGDKGCLPTDHYNGSPLMAESDYTAYYALVEGRDGYAHYGQESQYAKDISTLVVEMDRLMESYRSTGLYAELRRQGFTPALMFDIDNTLEFSGAPDSDAKGDGPAIEGVVEFAKRWCFKDGLACYFITARACSASSVPPTAKWLKHHLQLSDEQIRRYTHFSRNTQQLTCDLPDQSTVAYKDVIREALTQREQVFWLMSIGDQLTDSLGLHSGMKMRVPNQFFHSDIVPNQYAPWGKGECGSPTTIAPPRACAAELVGRAIEVTSLEYCQGQPATAY